MMPVTRMRTLLLLSALLLSPPVEGEVYRCEDAGGLVFTDHPCAAGAPALHLPEPNRIDATSGADLVRQYDERLQRERQQRDQATGRWLAAQAQSRQETAQQRRALIERRVIKGMSPDQVRQSWGQPEQVEETAKGERWVYLQDGKRRTVSFVEARVSAVSAASKRRR